MFSSSGLLDVYFLCLSVQLRTTLCYLVCLLLEGKYSHLLPVWLFVVLRTVSPGLLSVHHYQCCVRFLQFSTLHSLLLLLSIYVWNRLWRRHHASFFCAQCQYPIMKFSDIKPAGSMVSSAGAYPYHRTTYFPLPSSPHGHAMQLMAFSSGAFVLPSTLGDRSFCVALMSPYLSSSSTLRFLLHGPSLYVPSM